MPNTSTLATAPCATGSGTPNPCVTALARGHGSRERKIADKWQLDAIQDWKQQYGTMLPGNISGDFPADAMARLNYFSPGGPGDNAELSAVGGDTHQLQQVNSATGFLPDGVVQIDDELIRYTGAPVGNSLVSITRGYNGSKAAPHAVNSVVSAVEPNLYKTTILWGAGATRLINRAGLGPTTDGVGPFPAPG